MGRYIMVKKKQSVNAQSAVISIKVEKPETIKIKDTEGFDRFVDAILKEMARAYQIPYDLLFKEK